MKTNVIKSRGQQLPIVMSAPVAKSPQGLSALARKYHETSKQIKRLQFELEALKTKLMPSVPLGETRVGKWRILKSHYNAASIPAYTRPAYDVLKVEEVVK